MPEKILTPDEVAELLRVQKATVYELVKSGKLQAFKVGNRYRFKEESLEEYIQQQQVGQEDVE